VVVHGYNTANGGTANFKLFTWFATGDAGNMAVTATPAAATNGGTGTVNVSFTGLAPATRYVGSIQHRNGAAPAGTNNGTTIVNVTTP